MAAKSKAVKAPAKAAAAAKSKATPAKAAKPAAKAAAKSATKPTAKAAAKPVPKSKPAVSSKVVAKKAPVKTAAKPASKPTAKVTAKPAAKAAAKPATRKPAPKPAAKPAPKPAAKPAPKPAANSPSKPAAIAKKAVSTVKSITQAIVGMVKPTPAAKSAAAVAKTTTAVKKPEPAAAKVASAASTAATPKQKVASKDASSATGNMMKPSVTPPKSSTAGSGEGTRARAVAPSRPLNHSEPLVAHQVVRVELPAGYKPSSKEEYMCAEHLEYFRQKLINWRAELVEESKQTIDNLREEVRDVGDEAERATRETENSLELRTRDRYRKLISKIEKALKRVDDGSYGYCEETGEEIGIDRLEARPIATLCLDAQERWEHRQRLMGD